MTGSTDATDATGATGSPDTTAVAGSTRRRVAARTDPPRHLVLLGMMGAGKTRTGAALSVRLGWPFVDGDAVLEAQQGRTGAQIAAADGVDHLHVLEEQVLLEALSRDQLCVIAPAAWVVEDARCLEAMRASATVAWLDLPADQLGARMRRGAHRRAMAPTEVQELLDRRRPRFAEAADLHLDATAATDDLVAQIVAHLGDQGAERSDHVADGPDQGPAGAGPPGSAT